MSKSLGTLTLDLVAKTGGFVQGMDAAERKSAKWRKQVEKDVKAAGKVMGVALAAGATAAATGLVVVIERQRELIDQQAKLAQRYRTTYESISTLTRAGDLAGVTIGQIETASKGLEQRLGQAIQGTDAQREAFDRLGISAQEIADLPLDQRIAEINKALRANVQASERAAVASKIFGEEGAITMQALDPATIAEAARQVEIFGLNLSDVDAAKVEMANDALSTFGMAADGIGKQLTVELAPILRAIGNEFLDTAEDAGGMGTSIRGVVDNSLEGLAFIMDAGDGVGRSFEAVGKTISVIALEMQHDVLEFADAVWNGPVDALNALIETSNRLPGINISTVGLTGTGDGIRADLAVIEGAITEAQRDIAETLNAPLAGQQFLQFVAKAREDGESAAQAVVAGRIGEPVEASGTGGNGGGNGGGGGSSTADEIKSAAEAQKEYMALVQSVTGVVESSWSDQSRALQAYQEQVETLREGLFAGILSDDQYEQTVEALEARNELFIEKNEELLEVNAGFWQQYMEAAEENLGNFDILAGNMLENFSGRFGDAFEAMVFDAETLGDAVSGMAEGMARSVVNAIGEMIAQWLAYQAVQLVMGKTSEAAAVAGAAVAGPSIAAAYAPAAAMASLASFGGNSAPAMAGMTATVGLAEGMALMGMAHDGIDSIPKTGSWFLEKGERVMTSQTSAKLDATLDRAGKGGGGTVVNVNNAPPGTYTTRTTGADGKEVINVILGDLQRDGPISRSMGKAFGVKRSGR